MASSYDESLLTPALKLMTKAKMSLLTSGTYYLAESSDGMVIGCGGWTLERPGSSMVEPHLGHIRHVGTHPDWINQGIGRAIYRLCETNARSAGVATFECYSSLNAQMFYSTLGFKIVRMIDIELEPNLPLPCALMRRQI